MDFYKEYFVAIASILLFASCSTKRFAEHGLVDQNKQPVQLVLVSLKDTVFDHTHYDSVFKVSLINTGRKPFRLREPSVTHNSLLQFAGYISVEYTWENCGKCRIKEDEELVKPSMRNYIWLTQNKPYTSYFYPVFDKLICIDSYDNEIKERTGEYQIRTFCKIGNDTIYSNSVVLYYLEK